GASGFVGRSLVAALLRANYAVRAATRQATSFPDGVECVIVPDFINPVDWDRIVRGADVIVHAAGLAHADSAQIPEARFDRVNRWATQKLAAAAARAGVGQFVFLSSVRAQAGPSATYPLREQSEPHPTDAYGRSKLAAEAAIRATGVPFTIFRPVVIYGPHARANIRFLVRLASSPLPLPFAGFNNKRSLVGIDNLISAILFALSHPSTLGETYLAAEPEAVSVQELFTMLRKAQGRRADLINIPLSPFRVCLIALGQRRIWDRIGGELIVDTRKLEATGWRPVLDTYSGLAAALLYSRRPGAPYATSQGSHALIDPTL